jgi:hypothetical protein
MPLAHILHAPLLHPPPPLPPPQAERQAALAAEAGTAEAQDSARRLEAQLMVCQQALLDQEAAAIEKDKRLAELSTRWGGWGGGGGMEVGKDSNDARMAWAGRWPW